VAKLVFSIVSALLFVLELFEVVLLAGLLLALFDAGDECLDVTGLFCSLPTGEDGEDLAPRWMGCLRGVVFDDAPGDTATLPLYSNPNLSSLSCTTTPYSFRSLFVKRETSAHCWLDFARERLSTSAWMISSLPASFPRFFCVSLAASSPVPATGFCAFRFQESAVADADAAAAAADVDVDVDVEVDAAEIVCTALLFSTTGVICSVCDVLDFLLTLDALSEGILTGFTVATLFLKKSLL
jgi:hypothetical protein